ncbi:MAG: class C sortase [Propionibacteriaceae bacterium]|nr:class C sortase [Propionibacteriaceae bacterium]
MKRKLILVLVILLGIGALAYPTVSNYLAVKHGSQAVQAYEDKVAELSEADINAALAAAEQYNQSLTGQPVHDPFLEGTGMAMTEDYWQMLRLGQSMGYLDIPKIGLLVPIYHGTSDSVLQKGVGHLEGSTLPIGGSSRHTVLTGHTGLTHAKLFTDLIELVEGDQFYIRVLNQVLAYEVGQIKVIEPQDTQELMRFEGKDYATLLTCTPYGVNSHRLLVRGERVEYLPEVHDNIEQINGSAIDKLVFTAAVVTATAMGVLIGIVMVVKRRRKKQRAASGGVET